MITEIVEFETKAGTEEQFIAGVKASEALFKRSAGFISLELHRTVENASLFVLLIQWESVAHHMDMFQKAPEYKQWRANVGAFMAGPPRLQHSETILDY